MTDHELQQLAKYIAKNQAHPCVFDAETIQAIKEWALTFKRLKRAAWWAGGVVGVTFLGCMATGAWYVIVEGLKTALHRP